MESKEKHKLQRRIFVLLLFALLPTCCTGDKVFRNVLYWEVKPYIYHDTDGNLTGIYVDANNALLGTSIEQCDGLHPAEAGRYNYTYVKTFRSEILHLYNSETIKDTILFPILYEPRDVNEGFPIKSEGIAVIMKRKNLEMPLKFMLAFFKIEKLLIMAAICVFSGAIVMLVMVRTFFFTIHYTLDNSKNSKDSITLNTQ